MPPIRVLCVDDELAIQQMMPSVLGIHGFDVTSVGTVAKALAEIASQPFDVLIADLNIGQPGDGFTVVSSMRRTHPDCLNFILTGYPALETALQAVRSHVDEYLIKPLHPATLVATIEHKMKDRKPAEVFPTRRLSHILRDQSDEICQRTLVAMKVDPELAALPLSDEQRSDHTQEVLKELAEVLESPAANRVSLRAAVIGGEQRYAQKYPFALLAVNARLLQGVIYDVINENLLSLDLSHLMLDLKRLNENLALQAEEIVRIYMQAERRSA
jgi:DNA-binding response OmpR family regulator